MDRTPARRWRDALGGLNPDPATAEQALDRLLRRYGDPARAYHTLDHVVAVLDAVEGLAVTEQ
ncbi:MAG: hypothetical protein ACRDU8_01085, partial [Egibacteraceae bacterium]